MPEGFDDLTGCGGVAESGRCDRFTGVLGGVVDGSGSASDPANVEDVTVAGDAVPVVGEQRLRKVVAFVDDVEVGVPVGVVAGSLDL